MSNLPPSPNPAKRLPPAQWYRDPSDPTMLRWWNGTAWTQHQAPYPKAQAEPAPQRQALPKERVATPAPWPASTPVAPTSKAAVTDQRAVRSARRWFGSLPAWIRIPAVAIFGLMLASPFLDSGSNDADNALASAVIGAPSNGEETDDRADPAEPNSNAVIPLADLTSTTTEETTTTTTTQPTTTTTETPTSTAAPTSTEAPTTEPPTTRPPTTESPTTQPPTTAPPTTSGCHPSYTPCVPFASDVDCAGGSGNGPEYTGRVSVIGPDEYDLDRDGDGVGCE